MICSTCLGKAGLQAKWQEKNISMKLILENPQKCSLEQQKHTLYGTNTWRVHHFTPELFGICAVFDSWW